MRHTLILLLAAVLLVPAAHAATITYVVPAPGVV